MIVESVDVEEEEDAVGREAKAASIEPLAAATREPLSRTRLTLLTLLTPPVLVIVKPSSVNTQHSGPRGNHDRSNAQNGSIWSNSWAHTGHFLPPPPGM